MPELYNHVALKDAQLDKLLTTLKPTYYHLVQSLTVVVDEGRFRIQMVRKGSIYESIESQPRTLGAWVKTIMPR